MSESDERRDDGDQPAATTTRPGRRWEPPTIDSGQLYEVHSLQCEKADPECLQPPPGGS